MSRHETTNYRSLLPYVRYLTDEQYLVRYIVTGSKPVTFEYSGLADFFGDPVYYMTAEDRSPEVQFAMNHSDETVRPLSYRDDNLGRYLEVYWSANVYNSKLYREIDDYLWQWLKRLKVQGMTPAKVR